MSEINNNQAVELNAQEITEATSDKVEFKIKIEDVSRDVDEFFSDYPENKINAKEIDLENYDQFKERGEQIVNWFNSKNVGIKNAITSLLIKLGHKNPTKWLKDAEPNLVHERVSDSELMFLVKRALHLAFLEIEDTDIRPYLIAINSNMDTESWFAVFENQVAPVMVELNV